MAESKLMTLKGDNYIDRVPAPEQYSPDYNLLEPDAGEIREDESPTDCTLLQRIECGKDALKLLRNRFKSDREYLIWLARYLLQLKLEEMEEIFRLHTSNLCRISKRAESSLQKRDDSN